jgi:hypothetical protein
MKTIMIIAEVGEVDRKDLENIESNVYESHDDFKRKVAFYDKLSMFSLSDFMDGLNNQEIDNLTDCWVGYVFIK